MTTLHLYHYCPVIDQKVILHFPARKQKQHKSSQLKICTCYILLIPVSGQIYFLFPSLPCVGLNLSAPFCCPWFLLFLRRQISARRDKGNVCVIISSCFQVKMSLRYFTDVKRVRLKKPCPILNIACEILPPSVLTFLKPLYSYHNSFPKIKSKVK